MAEHAFDIFAAPVETARRNGLENPLSFIPRIQGTTATNLAGRIPFGAVWPSAETDLGALS